MYSRVNNKIWITIEIVIQMYPENKRKLEDYTREIVEASCKPEFAGEMQEDYTKPQSCTEAKALKLATSEYYKQLKKEVEGVEMAYNSLTETEQRIIKARFWSNKAKKIPYLKMGNTGYSERQMKRIVYRMIERVGRYIGKIE